MSDDPARRIADRHFGGGFSRERTEALYRDIAAALADIQRERDNARRTVTAQNTVIAGLVRALEDRDGGLFDPVSLIARLETMDRRDDA